MRTVSLVIATGIVLLVILFNIIADGQWGRRLDGLRFWEDVYEPPSSEFKAKCELRKAFRIYRDHEGVWSCKLEDGRVMNEKNFRKFLNN